MQPKQWLEGLMTTKRTEETKGQGKVRLGVLAEDIGLNHEAGPGRTQYSIKRAIGQLFDRAQRATRRKS